MRKSANSPIIYDFNAKSLKDSIFSRRNQASTHNFKGIPAEVVGVQDYESLQCLDVKASIKISARHLFTMSYQQLEQQNVPDYGELTFGDYKTYTSLKLLTNVLGIPSPKDDIDGSEVSRVYYEENDIDRIIIYCEKDTLAVANLLLRYKGDEIIPIDNLISV